MGGAPNMVQDYKLTIANESDRSGSVCCFQGGRDAPLPGEQAVAWFAHPQGPGSRVSLSWKPDYQFVWAEMDRVAPGPSWGPTKMPPLPGRKRG